jgi:hypothetical protein
MLSLDRLIAVLYRLTTGFTDSLTPDYRLSTRSVMIHCQLMATYGNLWQLSLIIHCDRQNCSLAQRYFRSILTPPAIRQ